MAKPVHYCYICGEVATSKEHAPARAFFPKGSAHRLNLIKVHSCKKHNEETSKDDEYVRNIIAMSVGNNAVAFNQFIDRVVQSFRNSPALLTTLTKNSQKVYIREGNNTAETTAFQIDRDRIDKVLKKIAYAIFHHKCGEIWKRELIIQTEYLRTESMEADEFGKLIQAARPLLGNFDLVGDNPQVFKYQFLITESDDINDQLLVMKFYEGFEVWAAPKFGSTKAVV